MKRAVFVALVACLAVLACTEAAPLTPAARIATLGWKQAGPASAKATVKFTFALKQRNLELFESLFLEISNPKSPQYAQYLSIDEILDIVAPPAEDAETVINWLKHECEENKITNLRDAIKVESNVACVEKMFGVKLFNYKYKNTPYTVVKTKLNTPAAVIPKALAPYVELLEGLSRLPIPRRTTKKTEYVATDIDDAMTFNYVIPSVARRIYNIPEGTKIQASQSSHSVIEFLPVGAPFISDMQMFAQQANETFSNVTKIIGPWEEGNDGESTLDIQYISALAPGGENWYITIEDGWQYEFALELFNMADAPWINSVSYGWPEQHSCQSGITHANCKGLDSKTYVERANVEFQKIGTRGISVIVCSQDEGAPSEANEGCQLDNTHPLWPIYPSASPWVTTVSATTVIDGTTKGGDQPQPPICSGYTCASGTLEYPCMINNTYYTWTTGGGFSAFAPRPSYQETAVQQWLSSSAIIPPLKFFNSSNRGYPDISALGSRILIIQGGAVAITAGTSASTPIIAAIMALLNDYRFQQGKPSLGFLNPLLYQMAAEAPQTFKTIPVGNNAGTIDVECTYGYGAGWGWDPVTGLGTPNFGEMINYLDNNLP